MGSSQYRWVNEGNKKELVYKVENPAGIEKKKFFKSGRNIG